MRALVVIPAVAALVAAATPASAGGATVTRTPVAAVFSGSVQASLSTAVSRLSLADYASAEHYDRVVGGPGGSEFVTVGQDRCRHDVRGGLSGISVYGESTTWAAMPVHSSMGARVEVQCRLSDGTQHVLHWGNRKNQDGTYALPSSNCVVLTRTGDRTFTVSADAACTAQDEVINSRVQQVSVAERSLPFSGVLTVG